MYMAAFVCFITVMFIPLSFLFIYIARKAYIKIDDQNFTYKMVRTKVIPFANINRIRVGSVVQSRNMINSTILTFATVVPLIIHYNDNKKMKLSLNYFDNPQEIVKALVEKTGKEIEVPDELKQYIRGE